ncbi:MAG: glucuronate isomerase [Bacteroidaceae bacterium]|nr:glucuronate isomerase [Bacteroidaceae bacterium]
MKKFMDKDFMLESKTAQDLYHNHAAGLPIIDYHCHLNPKEVAEDHKFSSITELWLGGDHYKWRALRANGIPEEYITGNASDWDKFQKWAQSVPYMMRNPIYHWTHLELKTAFGIDKILNPDTAKEIYDECNEKLQQKEFSARGLMRKYNVEVVCTTDDPIDSLEYHKAVKESGFECKVLPTWRPDKAQAVENPSAYKKYIEQLSIASGIEIKTYTDLIDALRKRHNFFEENGCRLSDHGMDQFFANDYKQSEIDTIFKKVMSGKELAEEEQLKFKSAMFTDFAVMDAESGWTQQFHFGPQRNNNSKMFAKIGPDTGFDSMGECLTAKSMAKFLDRLNSMDKLAKTIVYNLNPNSSTMVATMLANFQDGSVPGKMQYGAGWWFLDQKYGMIDQMNVLSMQGLLSRFVGMLTDSRSFVSYARHEYFRRIMCNLIATDVENGELPVQEMPRIEEMVRDISYFNAKRFFNF